MLFGPHDLLYICSAKHQFRQLALHPAARCHGPVCMRVKLILLPPGTVLPAYITLSYQFIPIANDSCNQTSISNIQESISPKKRRVNLLGIWFRTLCLIFHLWALNATRLPWRCGKLCTNQALAAILRMNQASAASCARVAPWHASKHEGGEATCASAKGGSEVCTSSASTCVRLGRVLKKPLYLFKRVQNFHINKEHHVHDRIYKFLH